MEGVLNQLFAIIYLRGMDDCPPDFCHLDLLVSLADYLPTLLTLPRHRHDQCKSRTLAMTTYCTMVWRKVALQVGTAVAAGSAITARFQVFV